MLYIVLVSLPSYHFILMCSFVGCYGYLEHDLPISRVPDRLRDVERLRLYAQSVISDHKALSASLAELEPSSRSWENVAKESVEKMARAKEERDVARHDASMARMDANAAGSARAKVETELARV